MHTKHKERKVDDSTNVTEDDLKGEESSPLKVMESKPEHKGDVEHQGKIEKYHSWKRMILLVVAMTVHNIPGKYFFGYQGNAFEKSYSLRPRSSYLKKR